VSATAASPTLLSLGKGEALPGQTEKQPPLVEDTEFGNRDSVDVTFLIVPLYPFVDRFILIFRSSNSCWTSRVLLPYFPT
jgi:hypothetical protein